LKRAFDLLVSAVSLPLLVLPMLLIALGVKWSSPGPVFYRQERASLGGKPFQILKFRTMVVDAEKSVGPVWAFDNDSRATRFGRFLRRTSLDELPQLLNVLWGDMSLVGPRPERPELIERFRHQVPRYMLRHHVKAGLTGWAQVHGLRGRTSLRKRIQYDLYYIRHWTFGLDLWILALTPFRGLVNPNAY
jgi:putative colanic acid biosynthesis UDP-glucose lipid carrier transferase